MTTLPVAAQDAPAPAAGDAALAATPNCTTASDPYKDYACLDTVLGDGFFERPEFYSDAQGQRAGTKANYIDFSGAWQHWFSPQVDLRPEFGYYHSYRAAAVDGGTRNSTWIGAADLLLHF